MPASPADSSPSSPDKATLHSPWAAVVRGDDDKETTPPPPASSPSLAAPDLGLQRAPELLPSDDYREAASDGNVVHGKAGRPAWKAFPNGVIEASAGKDVDGMIGGGSSGVMADDVAWPALSESTRTSSKSLSSDSSSAILSKLQAEGSPSDSQGLVLPNSPQNIATNNFGSPKAAENSTIPQRRKPSRRSDAGAVTNSSSLPGGFNHPQLVPPMTPAFRVPPNGFVNIVPPIMDFLSTEPPYRGSGWDGRPAGVFGHPPMGDAHAISPRRGSFGPRDGNPQHNNYRNRRDQGRRNPPDRRDGRLQQQQRGVTRGYRGPPPPTLNAPVYMAPQSVRPTFGPSIGLSDVSSPCFFPAFPMDMYWSPTYMPPPPPTGIMMPMPTIPLHALLEKQIDYYFSDDNLVKDDYLKSNMDNQGWVPISLIAGFPRVRTLTANVQVILESLGDSSIVEVKEDKIRRRGEWMKWVRFPAHGLLELGSPSSMVTNCNDGSLASSLRNITLEGKSSADCGAEKNSQMENSDPHGNSSDRMASF